MSSLTLNVLAILISAVVYSYAENSTNSNLTKCLSSLNEVERELSSKIPPLKGLTSDNWRNISRALFPALKQPSLYIKVTLRIISNQTVYEVKKFTWAESCAFVTDVFIDAATVFSLGTLWPQRRQAELDLTVHRLCNKSQILKENGFKDENEAWRYVLLTLQDIAILPNLSDPRVNTAQCVVVGHEGDVEQPIVCPDWNNWRGIWIYVASVASTIVIYWFAKELFDRQEMILFSKTCIVLTLFCFILMVAELIYILYLLISELLKLYFSHLYFKMLGIFLYIFSYGIFFFIPFCCSCTEFFTTTFNDHDHKDKKCNPNLKKLGKLGSKVMLACTYQIVYHLLWVLCGGIPADPSWALPMFLCECVIVLALFFGIYLYFELIENVTSHPVYSACAACVVMITIGVSFYGSKVDENIGNVLVIAIPAVLLWFYKDSGSSTTKSKPESNPSRETPV